MVMVQKGSIISSDVDVPTMTAHRRLSTHTSAINEELEQCKKDVEKLSAKLSNVIKGMKKNTEAQSSKKTLANISAIDLKLKKLEISTKNHEPLVTLVDGLLAKHSQELEVFFNQLEKKDEVTQQRLNATDSLLAQMQRRLETVESKI